MNRSIIFGISFFSYICSVNATQIQVLPPASSFGGQMGEKLGKGFSEGLEQGIKERRRRKEQEKNTKLLQQLLKDYHPSSNFEYVIRILQSSLPEDLKKLTINVLNEQHERYLKENRRK